MIPRFVPKSTLLPVGLRAAALPLLQAPSITDQTSGITGVAQGEEILSPVGKVLQVRAIRPQP